MKIKLILASSKTDPLRKNDPFMPLSLPLLAALAPGHDYSTVDMLWEDEIGFDDPVDLVGISVRLTAENEAYRIAQKFRKRNIPVVLGGPQVSSVPLRAIQYADAIVIGEAENLWPKVVSDVENNALKQFYVCSPEKFEAPGYSVVQDYKYPDLLNIPVAKRRLMHRKYTFDTVFAVRGCPVGCDFCSVPQIFGTEFRMRPVEQVIAEIDTFRNYYYLLDDSVFGKPSTYDYYISLYERIAKLKKLRFWTGQANLDAVATEKGREVIHRARDAGLLYAAIGMESIHPQTLQKSGSIRKSGTTSTTEVIDKMKEAIWYIQGCGIIVSGWFVVGYDDDTVDTYYKTLQFCEEMHIIPAIFPVKALPNTPLHRRLASEGKLDDSKRLNYRNPNIPDEEIKRAFQHIREKAFSMKSILKRTAYYAPMFGICKIHKTIFSLVLQTKLRAGIDISNDEFFSPELLNSPEG